MAEDLKALVKQMAEAKGLGQYWPIIEQVVELESSWNPSTPSTYNAQGTEDSWGLFQLNRMSQGLGTGYSTTALKNPRTNAEIALNKIASVIQSGGTIQDALGDWVNARNTIFGGQGGATEGGAVMAAGTQTTTPTGQTQMKGQSFWDYLRIIGFLTEPTETTLANGEVISDPGGELRPGVTADIINQMFTQWSGQGAATGTATTTTTIPSAQETAIGQWDMETWLSDAILDEKKFGLDVAATNFANKIAQAQEGRLQATAAQEYARNLAPPGMTELKLGPLTGGIPLGPAVPSTYAGAMELANVPQAPELQYQPGALPQPPNLAALPSTQQSTQVTVPYAGGGATLPAPAGSERSASYMQAIRNYIARFGQTFPGGQLPAGRG
jgi:hypothetical protein